MLFFGGMDSCSVVFFLRREEVSGVYRSSKGGIPSWEDPRNISSCAAPNKFLPSSCEDSSMVVNLADTMPQQRNATKAPVRHLAYNGKMTKGLAW